MKMWNARDFFLIPTWIEAEMHNSPRVTHVLSFKKQLSRAGGELKIDLFLVLCDMLVNTYSVACYFEENTRKWKKIVAKIPCLQWHRDNKLSYPCLMERLCSTLGFNLDSGTWDLVSSELQQSEISLKKWKDVFVIPKWNEAEMHKSSIATHFLSFKEQTSRAAGGIECCALSFVWRPGQYLFMCLSLRGAYRTAAKFVAGSMPAVRDGKLPSSCLMEEFLWYPGVWPIFRHSGDI